MKLTLIRSATLRMSYGGHTLLVDPQLDPAGARERDEALEGRVVLGHRTEPELLPRLPLAAGRDLPYVLRTHGKAGSR